MGNVTSGPNTSNFAPSDSFFLAEAARKGDIELLTLFLRKNPALVYAFTSCAEHSTAWHLASAAGHVHVLQLLMAATATGAQSNTHDPVSKALSIANSQGMTPLMLAAKGGHAACVRLLLACGADANACDPAGRNSLHAAAACGTSSDCALLILKEAGLDLGSLGLQIEEALEQLNPGVVMPERTKSEKREEAAVEEAEREEEESLDAAEVSRSSAASRPLLLLHSKLALVDPKALSRLISACDSHGRTPLHYAAWSGLVACTQAILAAGGELCAKASADCYEPDLPCNCGATPLHLAALKGHTPVVIVIVAHYVKQVLDSRTAAAETPGQPLISPSDPRLAVDGYGATPFSSTVSRDPANATSAQAVMSRLLHPHTLITELLGGSLPSAGTVPTTSQGTANANEVSSASLLGRDSGGRGDSSLGQGEEGEGGKASSNTLEAVARNLESLLQQQRQLPTASNASALPPSQSTPSTSLPSPPLSTSNNNASQTGNDQPSEEKPTTNSNTAAGGASTSAKQHSQATGKPHSVNQQLGKQQQQQQGGNGDWRAVRSTILRKASQEGGGGEKEGLLDLSRLYEQPLPDWCMCPLTCEVMRDPVVAADGHSYERSAFARHLQGGSVASPTTKQRLSSTVVYPNTCLKQAIKNLRSTALSSGQ